jgi:hypothetical protein
MCPLQSPTTSTTSTTTTNNNNKKLPAKVTNKSTRHVWERKQVERSRQDLDAAGIQYAEGQMKFHKPSLATLSKF